MPLFRNRFKTSVATDVFQALKINSFQQVLAGSHKMGRIDHGFIQNTDENKKGQHSYVFGIGDRP